MRIEETFIKGFGILALTGDLIMAEIPEVKDLLKPFLEDRKYDGLILNLKNVHRIDATGLGLIVSTFKTLGQTGKTFALSSPNETNRAFLRFSNLDRILTISESDEAALLILDGISNRSSLNAND